MGFADPQHFPDSPKLFPLVMLALVIPRQVLGFYPFTLPNYMMVGQVMKAFYQVDRLRCLQECHMNEQCLSYNFEPTTGGNGLCELNRCGVKDSREREKSLVHTQGVFFHQIRPSKLVDQVTSKFTGFFFCLSSKHKLPSM